MEHLSFRIKISEKNKNKKFENYLLSKKFSKSRNDLDSDPDPFFSSADPGSESKLNGSEAFPLLLELLF